MIFDGKVLLNETLSGKTEAHLSSQLGGKGRGNGPKGSENCRKSS